MLSQLNKTGPVEATRKAFETIEEMVDKDDKFKRLLSALESAGKYLPNTFVYSNIN